VYTYRVRGIENEIFNHSVNATEYPNRHKQRYTQNAYPNQSKAGCNFSKLFAISA